MENSKEEEEKEETFPSSTKEKNAEMEKAVRFWTHPSLTTVSAEEKKQYLVSRGLSQEEIHKVWERIAEQEISGDDATSSHQHQVPPSSTAATPPSDNNNNTRASYDYPPQPQQQGAASVPPPPPPPPPPPHYPQQQQHYNTYYTDQQQHGSNNNDSMMDVPALLGIGAALGVTAAAAVRWLNGGDFMLLPPPTRKQQQQQQHSHVESGVGQARSVAVDEQDEVVQEDEKENGVIDDEYLIQDDESQQLPQGQTVLSSDDMQQVLELLESQAEKQDAILQQISNFTTKKVTDQSMQLLRQNQARSNDKNDKGIHKELEAIKVELQALSKSDTTSTGAAWERQLGECLTQLQECMKQLSSSSEATFGASNGALPQVDKNKSAQTTMDSLSTIKPQTNTAAASPPTATEDTSKSLLLRQAIQRLAQENEPAPLRAGAQLLYLYVINLSSHPHVPRYRKIFTTNESFSMVQQLKGGTDLLIAVGFENKGNCFEWQGGSDDGDTVYLKEAAAALSILKTCSSGDDGGQVATNALSVLRPSTPPPAFAPASALQTPVFIASPPSTKKHPLLDESGDGDSILDISNASEHFEQRLESLVQPVMDDLRMFDTLSLGAPKTNLSMRESEEDESEQDASAYDAVETKHAVDATNGKEAPDDKLGGKGD